MKSVGEVMAIGRTFQESLQKALRGLEIGVDGLRRDARTADAETSIDDEARAYPRPERLWYVADAFRARHGASTRSIELTQIDPWFLRADRGAGRHRARRRGRARSPSSTRDELLRPEAQGLLRPPPRRPARQRARRDVRAARHALGVRPVYKRVDTCAAEFATAHRLHLLDLRGRVRGRADATAQKVMVLGGGPNRIGQGIEFDYCCVHAALALREDGFETIMVNCNPETVSTDYDTSDRLYFEPLTLEDVLEIVDAEKPSGVIVQFGGQTPLKLARDLEANGRADHRHHARRDRPRRGPRALPAAAAPARPASSRPTARRAPRTRRSRAADEIGYPLVVRPSLRAGRPGDGDRLRRARPRALHARGGEGLATTRRCCSTASSTTPSRSTSTPSATAARCVIGGIMEHIEQAGVHSGDSACSLPPYSLSPELQDELRRQTVAMAHGLSAWSA